MAIETERESDAEEEREATDLHEQVKYLTVQMNYAMHIQPVCRFTVISNQYHNCHGRHGLKI